MKDIRILFSCVLLACATLLAGCEESDGPDVYAFRTVIDFEDAAAYLGGPSSYGENYYADYAPEEADKEKFPRVAEGFSLRKDGVTFHFPINDKTNYWSGGTAISCYNYRGENAEEGNVSWFDYKNQLSVYNEASQDSTHRNAGVRKSQYFGVMFMAGEGAVVELKDGEGKPLERKAVSAYLCPTSYLYGVAKNGNAFSKPILENGVFAINIMGYDAEGKSTTSGKPVRIYLLQKLYLPGVDMPTTWQKVDLSSLGSVAKLVFTCEGSDIGKWGLNTPAYVAVDDIVFDRVN